MSPNNVHARIERDRSGRTLIIAEGELDLGTVTTLRRALALAAEYDDGPLTLDARGITFCDSTGLRLLLAPPADATLRLRDPSEPLRRLLELTGTIERFDVEDA